MSPAGPRLLSPHWAPAFACTTMLRRRSRCEVRQAHHERGKGIRLTTSGNRSPHWVPAFAGTTMVRRVLAGVTNPRPPPITRRDRFQTFPCNAKVNHERVLYTDSMPPLLEAKGLTKRYGRTVALDGVSFDVGEGVTALLGPNGAGKSTAMKLFLGLIQPTSGTATILGEEPYRSVEVRSRIGYMPEHESLPKSMAASEFLMHMAQVSGIPPSQARTRAADVLRHVGLDEERFRPMGEYSTGMKQRVKLAQAIVHDPVLALLDEPTAGLDPEGRLEMLGLISRTANTFGISVMLSTHLMGDVERTADSVIVLEAGALAQQGAVAKLTEETETLLIEVADRQEEFAEALAGRGVRAASNGPLLLVEHAREEDYDLIRDAAVESGARLRRLSPERRNLTDIFRSRPE